MRQRPLARGAAALAPLAALLLLPVADAARSADTLWRNLAPPQLVMDGGEPINVDVGHAAPAVFDIDGDGKKDLVVGQFDGGKVRVYLNRGSDTDPRFDGFTYLTAGGKEASVPYG
jgi:hypothetical protein